mmetsp:Transcript_45295/g.61834  ORF Transcript_45295/g.61834 Transcript_45295/m.61834 type:complete len:80 (-) Transcript_45295:341-580(-)
MNAILARTESIAKLALAENQSACLAKLVDIAMRRPQNGALSVVLVHTQLQMRGILMAMASFPEQPSACFVHRESTNRMN